MSSTLSTTAWVLHDLGLATSVGGSIFGKAGLHPAVQPTPAHEDRGEVGREAWKHFTPLNLVAHVAVVLTWLVDRSALTGLVVDRRTRDVVHAKDALVGVFLASGLASAAAGYASARVKEREAAEEVPSGEALAMPRSCKLARASTRLGTVNLLAGAALIGVSAVLAMRSGRSATRSLMSLVLP